MLHQHDQAIPAAEFDRYLSAAVALNETWSFSGGSMQMHTHVALPLPLCSRDTQRRWQLGSLCTFFGDR